jgi:hypothetical protein
MYHEGYTFVLRHPSEIAKDTAGLMRLEGVGFDTTPIVCFRPCAGGDDVIVKQGIATGCSQNLYQYIDVPYPALGPGWWLILVGYDSGDDFFAVTYRPGLVEAK